MLEIEIVKDEYGCLYASAEYQTLFKFRHQTELNRWLFWVIYKDATIFPGESFPFEYFYDACRAKYFLLNGGKMPEYVRITKGMRLLNK